MLDSVKPHVASKLAALAFFDLFDYPLTSAELRRYGGNGNADHHKHSWAASPEALAKGEVESTGGYWHLPGRAPIVELRRERYVASERKFARAGRVARWLSLLPSVRMVAVCNSLAIANAKEDSDIDLFVVTSPGAVWMTRAIATTALALLRLRPDRKTHADRVCLSFFVSEDALDLAPLAIGDDPYLRYWVATLVPLYDAGAVVSNFYARNRWVTSRLPGFSTPTVSLRFGTPARRRRPALLGVLRQCEPFVRRLQEWRFPREIREALGKGTNVIADTKMLKFHVGDRREEYARAFQERLDELQPYRTHEIASSLRSSQ